MKHIRLPDGTELELEDDASVMDAAEKIGPGLAEDAVAGKTDGELVPLDDRLKDGQELEIVTEDSEDYISVLRHSAAHVFAQALKRLHPEAKLTIGPWTDDGFYYDIAGADLDKEKLERMEEEMQEIIDEDLEIRREHLDRQEAKDFYGDNEYKTEILEDEAAGEDPVSFYRQGEFLDLCKGPHVESTGEVGAFKLLEVAGAYWRGDEENEQLTRVYGTAFPSEQELEEFMERRRKAEERDHRKIGQEMDLFSIPEHSPGCAHFHPNGMTIRRALERYIRTKNHKLDYTEVKTPELNKKELWRKSGHLDFFGDEGEFFLWETDGEDYGLKPMNCANHAYIYSSRKRSYRDLPIKLSEFGTVYRNEQSGELSGLLRVRGFTQDDGHAFIREDQIKDEMISTVEVVENVCDRFGFDVQLKIETKPDNAQGPDETWEKAEQALEEAMKEKGSEYEIEEGEASFYGPKIAVDAEDAIGREWTIGTVQLDFVIPRNLDLSYVGRDNEEHTPVMVHRAILGSIERFMGVMIEHFNGKFPTWLAPEQVRVLPVSDDNLDYAHEVANELSEFRVEVEERSHTVSKKIQTAHDDNVPYMLIVGSDEEEDGTVSIRDRDENEQVMDLGSFRSRLESEINDKSVETQVLQ